MSPGNIDPERQNRGLDQIESIWRSRISLKQWYFSDRGESIVGIVENAGYQYFSFTYNVFKKFSFKGGPSDLGTKILWKYWKIVLILPKPFDFHLWNPSSQSHPTTREIKDLLRPRSTPMGSTVCFYMSSSLIHKLKIHRPSFKYTIRWRRYGK